MPHSEKNLLQEQTIANSMALDSMLSKISIPPIPANRLQVLEIVRQPNDKINIDVLTRLLSVDPGLFAMMLQVANSSYYRGIEKINSLRGAITRIGLSDTVNSISFFCVKNALPPLPPLKIFSHEDYWAFSWTSAMAARRLGHPNLGMNLIPGELYMGGLLHGIGKLMMAIHYPEKLEKCFVKANRTKQPLYKVEQEVFGTIDGFLAAKILNSWNLPDNICMGVAYYQIPEAAPAQYREMAGCVSLKLKATHTA
ncbi:HDOD domain-containing protein [Desulfocicer niacini]